MINIVQIIYYTKSCSLVIDIQYTRFNESCVKITLLRSKKKILTGICNAVYFRLCIDLMHITLPVTAEGCDCSHHQSVPNNPYILIIPEMAKVQSNSLPDNKNRFIQSHGICSWQVHCGSYGVFLIRYGRKHCGKNEKMLVTSIFSFFHNVFTSVFLFFRFVLSQYCVVKG